MSLANVGKIILGFETLIVVVGVIIFLVTRNHLKIKSAVTTKEKLIEVISPLIIALITVALLSVANLTLVRNSAINRINTITKYVSAVHYKYEYMSESSDKTIYIYCSPTELMDLNCEIETALELSKELIDFFDTGFCKDYIYSNIDDFIYIDNWINERSQMELIDLNVYAAKYDSYITEKVADGIESYFNRTIILDEENTEELDETELTDVIEDITEEIDVETLVEEVE